MEKVLYMMIGGIGTGKTTLAKKLRRKLQIGLVSADEIQKTNKKLTDDEVDEKTLEEYQSKMSGEDSFILDGKCLNAAERTRLIEDAQKNGFSVVGYDFGSGTKLSLFRRLSHPRRFSSKYWEEVYEYDKKTYETPELEEGFEKIFIQPR